MRKAFEVSEHQVADVDNVFEGKSMSYSVNWLLRCLLRIKSFQSALGQRRSTDL